VPKFLFGKEFPECQNSFLAMMSELQKCQKGFSAIRINAKKEFWHSGQVPKRNFGTPDKVPKRNFGTPDKVPKRNFGTPDKCQPDL